MGSKDNASDGRVMYAIEISEITETGMHSNPMFRKFAACTVPFDAKSILREVIKTL